MREDVSDNALLLDLDEAAAQMSCCQKTMRGFIKSGELPYIVVGNGRTRLRRKIHPTDLQTFIEFGGGTTDVRLQA